MDSKILLRVMAHNGQRRYQVASITFRATDVADSDVSALAQHAVKVVSEAQASKHEYAGCLIRTEREVS